MIYILHDNSKWLETLKTQLDENKLEHKEWYFGKDTNILTKIEFDKEPPEGVFYNRVSASSHTRDARFSLEYSKLVVSWLEKSGRRVINGTKSLELELSKAKQYLELWEHGVNVPRTYLASNPNQILELSDKHFNNKCIVKDNRSGSGIGVKLVNSKEELTNYLVSSDYIAPIDGITLVQEYIESPDSSITRLEFIDDRLLYALRVDTSDGFKLCPADGCSIPKNSKKKFEIVKDFGETSLIEKLLKLIKKNEITICGIEFVRDKNNQCWVYDINCNTNYNKTAEMEAGTPLIGTNSLIKLLKG